MSERLEKLKLVKGKVWERQDPIDNIGVSTYDLIRDAIREDKLELAKDLVKYLYFWEIKFVRDANIDVVDGLPAYFVRAYGEYNLVDDYREILDESVIYSKGVKQKRTMSNEEWALNYAARMVRPHRMGKEDGWGGFVVEDYEDRIEIIWDPCYTGGRTRRGDPISGQPPHSQWPYNYAVTTTPHDWTWGYCGLSGYCVHCCLLHEVMECERTGGYIQQWNKGYTEDPWEPCRYIAYKEVDWIPESYYKRIGREKPPVTSDKPAPVNPKLLRVYHSDELGPRHINTGRRIWEAIDAGNKEEALRLVDFFDAECYVWHRQYPLRWNWSWIDKLIRQHGYNELHSALRSIPSPIFPPLKANEPRPKKAELPSAEEIVRKAALWGRGDRSGPDCSSVNVIEEEERYIIEFAPCGSCGRCLLDLGDDEGLIREAAADLKMDIYNDPTTSLVKEPYNFGVTEEKADDAWNKIGVPTYCTRCSVQFETASIARSGYLQIVIDRPENAEDPNCRWIVYKDVDDIPEEYYTRIGAKKPPRAQ